MQILGAAVATHLSFTNLDHLNDGSVAEMAERIRDILQLGDRDTFPAGRAVTLWRKESWRDLLSRWSECEVGRPMVKSLSIFAWMASLQIDSVSDA